jgi:hypothetical protein
MADAITLTRATQLGIESTHGTKVAATKTLQMLALEMGPNLDFKIFDGMARRFTVASAINKNMTVGKLAGKLNFTEIVYPLSSIWGAPTITTPGGGTISRKWLWTPPLSGVIDPKSLTYENGDANRAERFGYGICPMVSMELVREGDCQFESVVWGQDMVDPFTLTAALSPVPQIPIVGKYISIYADNTSGGLGGTKLLRVFNAKFGYADAWNVIWPMDRAQTSFATHIDGATPKPTLVLSVMADVAGWGLYADALANTTKYIRLEAIGPIIEAAIPYTYNIDMAVRITDVGTLKNGAGDIVMFDLTCTIIEDSAWGSGTAISAYVINTQTAL